LSLFREIERKNKDAHRPLADRMRPRTLDEFVGQTDFLGPGKLLRRMLEARRITSVIFYGPPGSGKTTLAKLIAEHVDACFVSLNAADSSVKEVRQVIDDAKDRTEGDGRQTLLFLDEIHHFNRTQQDILLPHVENGTIVLIGATTQNPFFSINAPLVSRSQIFGFQPHTPADIKQLLQRAIKDKARGFGQRSIEISPDAIDLWATLCDGDARRALTALDIAIRSLPSTGTVYIDKQVAEDSIQRKAVVYDQTGDEHYDVASAFIKSMRGSDPDAAIYWLARMLEAGEEARFIARRLVIFASEDIGCADPMALVVAQSAASAVEFIGLPEGQLNLAQAVIHLATAPKSNASAKAIWSAREDVKKNRTQPVPIHLRDRHYQGAKQLGHGDGYIYPHDHAEGSIDQSYMQIPTRFYEPTDHGNEAAIKQRLALFRKENQPNASQSSVDE
jgi:putative ATPase